MFKVLRPVRRQLNTIKSALPLSSHNVIRSHSLNPTDNAIQNKPKTVQNSIRFYSIEAEEVDINTYEKVCEETLESLTEFFEELMEKHDKLATSDISYSSGVLTANLGKYGVYVINRQSPNKQIWLSSPVSGPKRYDYVPDGSYWVYKHDMRTLHELLKIELSEVLGVRVDLSKCLHSKS